MNQFLKPKYLDYKNDSFYLEASELIGILNPKAGGSYVKYGKDKACDLDLSEKLYNYSFIDYTKKLISNKKKFELIDMHFNEPHKILKNIKNKLGYLNGNLEILEYHNISDDIKLLPKELRESIKQLINSYNESKNINDYVKLIYYIKNKLYPKWTWKDLKTGELEYYGQNFKISDYNFDIFYIEGIYNGFRISNYIFTKDNNKQDDDIMIWEIDDIIYENKLSYFKLLKKFMVFIKMLYFKRLINETYLRNNVFSLHNDIFNFIEEKGTEYREICLIKNKIDISKNKLKKYNRKLKKYSNDKYMSFIERHEKRITKLNKIYLNKMDKININSKTKYNQMIIGYEKYLEKYVKIQ